MQFIRAKQPKALDQLFRFGPRVLSHERKTKTHLNLLIEADGLECPLKYGSKDN